MAKRRKRKSSRRSNPEYSDAVYKLVMEFVKVIDNASSSGYKTAKKIQEKEGNLRIAERINRIAQSFVDIAEELEDELGDYR